ncbi:MAG TPA: Calx-beta domain-containing protein, partial [Pyrinomonadaceae bacterium]|nr:Calx-beta domain-containing protein [Pyrinomonadaceae bacterium]
MPEVCPSALAGRNLVPTKKRRRAAFLFAVPALLLTLSLTASAQQPVLSVKSASVTEGNAGTTNAAVTVELSPASGQTVTVQYQTREMTAVAGADFQHVTGTLTFSPGATQRTVNVPIVGDTVDEEDEHLFVQLTNATNAAISVSSNPPLLTILDDDATPRDVRLSATSYTFDEGAGLAVITVNRTGDLSVTSSVDYETFDSAARQRSDYLAAYGTLVFAPGESSKQVSVFITDDRWDEGTGETFSFIIRRPVNTAINGFVSSDATGDATVVIRDNDDANGTNPVRGQTFEPEFFVRQHYRDFFGRDPDAAGLAFWMGQTTNCGNADLLVCRINVSAAFFLSIEFQETGYLIYLAHEAAFNTGERLRIRDFQTDLPKLTRGVVVGQGDWEGQIEANKQAYYQAFVTSQQFLFFFPEAMTPAQFVDKMNENTGGVLSQAERNQLVAELTADNT